MKRLLPIGIQDFTNIRERGFVYIDKTKRIHELLTGSGKPFFLSRPRRFGKSLLCSTLEAIFEGRRELFKEIAGQPSLAINSLEWEWEKHPVIYIDLNPGDYPGMGIIELNANLNRYMELCAKKYGVLVTGETIGDKFARLIEALYDRYKKQVVVIIDEYDKPLLETINVRDTHEQLKSALKGFYSILNTFDKYIRFLFITGVSKFSKVSIFSDLNQLNDITLDSRYADICGFTQEEVERNFEPEISMILNNTGNYRNEYLENIRIFYNGYRFTKENIKVYNPFGLLNHFDKLGEFQSYWYDTATPSFLVKLITEQKINILNLNNLQLGSEDFRKYDIDNMDALPVLYQTGYLTISDYNERRNRYTLDYPNEEVRSCFSKTLIDQYLKIPKDRSNALYVKMPDALDEGNIEEVIDALRQFFSGIPYDIIKDTENYFQTAVHLIFSIFGLDCRSEVRISSGRIDTLVETNKSVFCFEFKIDKTAEEALAQIDTKEYLLPWEAGGKKLFKIGVNFDSEKRNIGEWKYKVGDK